MPSPCSRASTREPGKAAYLALENDPELEFLFFLGEQLGKTVAELRDMDYADFVLYGRYYARKKQAEELRAKRAG
jgi:hypothetical protein